MRRWQMRMDRMWGVRGDEVGKWRVWGFLPEWLTQHLLQRLLLNHGDKMVHNVQLFLLNHSILDYRGGWDQPPTDIHNLLHQVLSSVLYSKADSGHGLLLERLDLHWLKICFPIISNHWFQFGSRKHKSDAVLLLLDCLLGFLNKHSIFIFLICP